MEKKLNITVLVAPLDWGLGHATRCIPLIRFLLQCDCNVIIAAEEAPEKLLKAEFPSLHFVHLPGYKMRYSKSKRFFAMKIVLQLPKIWIAVHREKKWLNKFIEVNKVKAIISDNRYGFFQKKIPSIIITHQLLIQTPFAFAEILLQKINYKYLNNFAACWVPDEKGMVNFAGKLSHPAIFPKIPVRYIGGISRLERNNNTQNKFNVLIILSGPEPQRTILEKKILAEIKLFKGTLLLVRGLPGCIGRISPVTKNITVENHLSAKDMEEAFCCSEYIISRSGYTTVMDICKMQKKSILIPTPGQSEQEYLAAHLQNQRWCLSVNQQDFSLTSAIEKAQKFDYQLPQLNMEKYKDVISSFINTIAKSEATEEEEETICK